MSQTWHLPLLTTDTLSDSRGYLNDALEALRTAFSGSSAPSSPVAGQLHYDTDDNVLRIYNGTAWKIVGDADSDYLGKLPLSAGASYPLSADLYCGSHQLKGVANPTASTDGMTLGYADATYAKLAGATFTGAVAMGSNKLTSSRSVPDDDTELIRKDYADTKLSKSGGGMTGNLDINNHDLYGIPTGTSGTSGDKAANLAFVRNYFDTSTGHRHDASDGRRVQWTDLDSGSSTNGQIITANGSGGITVSGPVNVASGSTTGSVSIGTSATSMASADITSPTAAAKVAVICTAIVSGQVDTQLFVNVKRGSTTLISGANCWSAPHNSAYNTLTFAYDDTPGAGAHTYSFELYRTGGAATAVQRVVIAMVHA